MPLRSTLVHDCQILKQLREVASQFPLQTGKGMLTLRMARGAPGGGGGRVVSLFGVRHRPGWKVRQRRTECQETDKILRTKTEINVHTKIALEG